MARRIAYWRIAEDEGKKMLIVKWENTSFFMKDNSYLSWDEVREYCDEECKYLFAHLYYDYMADKVTGLDYEEFIEKHNVDYSYWVDRFAEDTSDPNLYNEFREFIGGDRIVSF